MLFATAFFAGVSICSAGFLDRAWQLLPPMLCAFPMIGFGYRTVDVPQEWNVLVTTSNATWAMTVAVLVFAFSTLRNRY
ncbi:hypothetical protein [Trueperella bialowiezensis]|uniref:hypothetical protein n=1 Tax=Trueperella bialowiezensis TaxID=312285 RepID=UPI000F8467B9|nr:hypothetical protein [Trueperella bialowiezensis]